MKPELVISETADQLAAEAARRIGELAKRSISLHGKFDIALAGGSTPDLTYRLLTGPDQVHRFDWQRIRFFFGDERFVPQNDPRSNYRMANLALFDAAPIPPANIFPVDTLLPSAKASAEAYSTLLSDRLGTPPVFDLILLGMGDDGHTASLFPHAAALDVEDRWAIDSPPGSLPPPVERVTITFPVIRAARNVLFLVAGENKALAVHDVLQGGAERHIRPSAGAVPDSGNLTWLLDRAAAKLLER